MAEDKDESQEKTQDPTSRRLEKAKEDGKVVTSREMQVFTILSIGVLLMYLMPPLLDDFLKITASFFNMSFIVVSSLKRSKGASAARWNTHC